MSTGTDRQHLTLEQKRALLRELLEVEAARARAKPRAIAPVDPSRPLQPSFTQERFWFMEQLAPGSMTYNVITALRVFGPLDRDILERTFEALTERHAVLRTTFGNENGVLVQRVEPARRTAIPRIDLSDLDPEARVAEAREIAWQDANTGFDLAHGPLYRVTLLYLREDEHVLLLTWHHIAVNGWSASLILPRDFSALYLAVAKGLPSPLPRLPVQFADYAAWERRTFHGEALESQLRYWRGQLAGAPVALDLPTDLPRPATLPVDDGGHVKFTWSSGIANGLRELARRENATLFMSMATLIHVLLARYSGQYDVVIGIESANRDRTEIENVVGCFVNTLALRADLSGNPSFVEALRRVRKATLGATSNRELPFDRLVQDLQPPRDRSRTPVFQVMFSMNNTPAHPLEVEGFRIEQFLTRNAASKFDLAIEAQEGGMGPHHPAAADQIIGTFSYRSTLFRHATIERMVARLERMAAEVIARPDTPIGSISLMDAEERARLLFDWNATDADHGPEGCLHDLLDAQARARPDRVAVETSSAAVTYGALATRVNALAAHLRREGVGPETVVALFSGPSIDALVGILGVLKAGGAYLPIDPAQPAARVAWMLEDSRPLAVLTTEALRPRLPAHGPRSILLDEPAAATEATPAVDSIARPEHLAYVIYTSGSTGKPKRVLVPHRCAVNTVRAQASIVGVTAGSRVAQFASLGFDASVWETFMALAAGATLCILGRREDGTVDDLGAALDALRVDTATLPPTVLAALEPHALPALTTVVVAGERLPAALAARWAAGRRLVNAYGPTEAAICATMHRARLGRGGRPAHRSADRERPHPRARPERRARARRVARRDLHRRRGRRPRIRLAAGADRAAVRARPVRQDAGGEALPHRRPRALARRRHAGVSRPR